MTIIAAYFLYITNILCLGDTERHLVLSLNAYNFQSKNKKILVFFLYPIRLCESTLNIIYDFIHPLNRKKWKFLRSEHILNLVLQLH